MGRYPTRATLAAAIAIHIAFATSVVAAAARPLRVGAARADITPPVGMGVPLGGYAERRGAHATGVHDRLYARALVLRSGRRSVVLVSVDLCFVPESLVHAVAAAIHTEPGLKSCRILLCATHTHSAPDPLAMIATNRFSFPGWSAYNAALEHFIVRGTATAVALAAGRVRAADFTWAITPTAGLVRNRRGDTDLDTRLLLLRFVQRDGGATTDVVVLGCHPTLFGADNLLMSADWPGVTCAAVERAEGPGATCLFINGAVGDAAPAGEATGAAEHAVADFGLRVADQVAEARRRLRPPTPTAVSLATATVDLPRTQPNGMFLAAAASMGVSIPRARAIVRAIMPRTTTVAVLRIGPVALVAVPCEATAAVAGMLDHAVEAGSAQTAMTCSLVNGWTGYAVSPGQYAEGNYEASMSFYGPSIASVLLRQVRRIARRHTATGRAASGTYTHRRP